jgi:hypothetical protein
MPISIRIMLQIFCRSMTNIILKNNVTMFVQPYFSYCYSIVVTNMLPYAKVKIFSSKINYF